MKSIFVDSNILLRYLAEDDPIQSGKAEKLLQKATAGELMLITGPPVLFEIAWTLRTAYKQSPAKILEFLAAIIAINGLTIIGRDLVEEAIGLAQASGEEFADAYIVVSAARSGAEKIATFNRKHFERLGASLYPL